MDFEKTIIKIGDGSIGFTLPPDLARFLGLVPGDMIVLRDEEGRKGLYASFWKKTTSVAAETAPEDVPAAAAEPVC